MPEQEYGSGSGDPESGGSRLETSGLTPLESLLHVSQPGRAYVIVEQNKGLLMAVKKAHTPGTSAKVPRGRKQQKQFWRRLESSDPALEVVHPDAAGIDIGSREHYVAVAPDRDPDPVRAFGNTTQALHQMAAWLKKNRIRSVAMQSTGVYWIPVADVLEEHGLEVWLVNARDTKNVPGRKSDVQECQWLMKLHRYGLLRKSFRPASEFRAIRTCWRERQEYVQDAARCIQRMQKALTEMNIQVATVLSDLSGTTGMRILRAIVAGERDGRRLAEFRDPRVKASKETIAESLEGTWRAEQLAVLRRQLQDWDHMQAQMAACDADLQAYMADLPTVEPAAPTPAAAQQGQPAGKKRKRRKKNGKSSRNEPKFDLAAEQQRITGVDLTRIDGIKAMTVQTIISEGGLDVSHWKSEFHYSSWLGLCPRNDVSGGKVLNRKTRKVVSRLATAYRLAATTLRNSDSYLGAQYRRWIIRLGSAKATTAMAAKLARLVYRLLKYGHDYVDKGAEQYEQKYREQQLRLLKKKAAKHGYLLVPVDQAA